MTAERTETIVIGAGQAGLSTSYCLNQLGREHVVLERGRVAETWRSCRWDGFYLNTPNWAHMLPGHPYRGGDPDGFSPLSEVIDYLEDYATATGADVREGVAVRRLHAVEGGYEADTEAGPVRAANVVVATGAYQRPTPVPAADEAPADVFQLTTNDYRRPEQLPPGSVLVVGSGQSGCQIAEELLQAGRAVYLSVGRCPWFPRRYRGREIIRWAIDVGLMDQTVDTLPSPQAKLGCNPPVSGNDGGHDCNPRWLAHRGAVLVGRVEGFDGTTVRLGGDVEQILATGDAFERDLLGKLDEFAAASRLDLPEREPRAPHDLDGAIRDDLDLRDADISTILWATGYRPDYGWIELPVVDDLGWPVQTRGVTQHPGLYFVGVHWLHKRKSSLLLGVGEDAEHVAAHIASA
jgi:putative flavoprotein involved in K+ transport